MGRYAHPPRVQRQDTRHRHKGPVEDDMAEYAAVNNYNSYVMGIHNYYGMATAANPDMQTLAYEIKISIKNR